MAKPPPKPTGAAPTISGEDRVGRTLTASDGSWTGGPTSYGKHWLRDNQPIVGADQKTYDLVSEDEGHMIRVIGTASNSAGKSVGVTSEGVGPIKGKVVPPIPIPPEPEPIEYPESVINPVWGTPLPHVWDLQFRGTGPQVPFANGKWQGGIDPYLESVGFYLGNYGQLLIDVANRRQVVAQYDFTGAPYINFMGEPGELILDDCLYATSASPSWPRDINHNYLLQPGFKVVFNRCTWDVVGSYQSSGSTEFNECKMTKQHQMFCDVGMEPADPNCSTVYNRCYIPGGGCKPAQYAHVELVRHPAPPGGGANQKFIMNDCMQDVSADGQADAEPYGGGWTGIWSIGDKQTEFNRCIMIGAPKVDASPTVPNSIVCVYAYGAVAEGHHSGTLTDCIMEPGVYGYCFNHSGTANRAVDGGGNRSLQNEKLTAVELGKLHKPHGRVTAPIRPDLFS